MEGLSIEEKAKAYDDLIERLKDFQFEYRFSVFCDTIERYFPELKESDDERIRKELIDYFSASHATDTFKGIPWDSVVAWLEKQAQTFTKKDVDDAYLKGVCDAKHELEKQGEQKPAIIIPKFRVGDEIKTSNEESLTITKIDEKGYWSEDLFICDFDEECLWDLVEQNTVEWNKEEKSRLMRKCVHRAYQQGYDTGFFMATTELEHNPTWSEEDDIMIHDIDYALRSQIIYPISKLQSMSNWILNLKNRIPSKTTWKPSHEQIKALKDDTYNIICSTLPQTSEQVEAE